MAEEKKKKEENKAPGWAWTALLATSIVIVIIIHAFSSKTSEEKAKAAPAAQSWQLCWEKNPDATMETLVTQKCMPATIQKQDDSIVVVFYRYGNGGKGMMEGLSSGPSTYDGNWKDKEGYGNFHLRFASNNSAVGWVDDKGEKPINLWLVKS